MAQPYVGEIRMFAGNFAPAGWMFCEGQLIPITENETLFNLIGTTYGGDGKSDFALPDLRGRLPLHQNNEFIPGKAEGAETITLTVDQLPAHTHPLVASADPTNTLNAANNVIGTPATATPFFAATPSANFAPQAISSVGGNQPHSNFQPYLCVNFIISLFGIFPSPT
jgi:microcystin-dependent protein